MSQTTDEHLSMTSSVDGLDGFLSRSDVDLQERVASLELRISQQNDEITCLKTALADVVRRLGAIDHDSTQNSPKKKASSKVRNPIRIKTSALPSLPVVNHLSPGSPRIHLTTSTSKRAFTPDGTKTISLSPQHLSTHSLKRWSSANDGFSSNKSNSMSSLNGSANNRKSLGPRDAQYDKDQGAFRMYLRGRPIILHSPSDLKDSFSPHTPLLAPEQKLKLEWVYGYRGRDCRSNLFMLPTGEAVYFIAAIVVLFNSEEQLQRHYLGHTDDVKCLAVHPDKVTIATGQSSTHDKVQGKAQVRVWDSVSLNTLRIIGYGEFERSVCCVGFSKSDGGVHLLTVDESNDHVLSVWDWHSENKAKKLVEQKSSQETVLGAEFHPWDSSLIVTCGKGQITFWNIEEGALVRKSGLFEKFEKPKFILSIAFADNGDILSGDSNGTIYVWSQDTHRVTYAMSGVHEGGIFALCVLREGTLLSGGGKDRKILAWNPKYQPVEQITELPETVGAVRTLIQGKDDSILIGTTRNAILEGSVHGDFKIIVLTHTDELWGLSVMSRSLRFITCGHDKHIILWDAKTHSPIWTKFIEEGCVSAAFHPHVDVVVLGTTNGRWLAVDITTREMLTVHTDGMEKLSCIEFSPDGNYVAVGSHDNNVYIYTVHDYGRRFSRIGRCMGHSSYITHLDWSIDSQYLVTTSGDYEILYWSVSTCRHVPSASSMRDIEWAHRTCTLGFDMIGIWPEGADGTDINTVDRSHSLTLAATGDDSGKVKLFRYPCTSLKASSREGTGHSSHITCVRFLYDDSSVLSTGGKDTSILQWTVV